VHGDRAVDPGRMHGGGSRIPHFLKGGNSKLLGLGRRLETRRTGCTQNIQSKR
jgi:hypothetical protein